MMQRILQIAERIRLAFRMLREARDEIALNPCGIIFPFRALDRVTDALGAVEILYASFAQALGSSYTVEGQEAQDRSRTALQVGMISQLLVQLNRKQLEALITDPDFAFRQVAQELLRTRDALDNYTPPNT